MDNIGPGYDACLSGVTDRGNLAGYPYLTAWGLLVALLGVMLDTEVGYKDKNC
jgi:hypothetical protein